MAANISHIVERFVAAINAHDVEQLVALMTLDHRLVDSLGNVLTGRDQMQAAWSGYFAIVPDYHIATERVFSDTQEVIVCGVAGGTLSTGSTHRPEDAWSTPVALRAQIAESLIAEWRVYADNEPLRERMRARRRNE
jgi:uncharacterized protein (TIGR02246 family)